MKLDPTMTGLFRMEWLVPLEPTAQDDYTRAVAEKSDALLRAARFMSAEQLAGPHDVEVRLWVEAALGNACVSITWEPGPCRFGFHLLDESLTERLACIVFDDVPCVDAGASLAQADAILDAALRALDDETVRIRVREPADERA